MELIAHPRTAIRVHPHERATAICPVMVDTRMVADVDIPPGQFKIDPETIAEAAAYALSLPGPPTMEWFSATTTIRPVFRPL